MNDNEADATATFHPPHLTEWLDEELEARGWSMGLLVTMLMVHRSVPRGMGKDQAGAGPMVHRWSNHEEDSVHREVRRGTRVGLWRESRSVSELA